jgi:hypothetical protein
MTTFYVRAHRDVHQEAILQVEAESQELAQAKAQAAIDDDAWDLWDWTCVDMDATPTFEFEDGAELNDVEKSEARRNAQSTFEEVE